MAKDPAFPFYAQDFLTGVMHLTMEERGMYITLLSYQWAHDKIPKKRVGLILGYEWDNISDELKCKFKVNGDFIQNERLEVEREKRRLFKIKQRENGRKGGRPRKPIKNPNDNQSISQINPLESEDEKENKDVIHIEDAYDFLKNKEPQKIELFEMQNKKSFPDYNIFIGNFNTKVITDDVPWNTEKLYARLYRLFINWDFTPKKTNEKPSTAVENMNKALGITKEY